MQKKIRDLLSFYFYHSKNQTVNVYKNIIEVSYSPGSMPLPHKNFNAMLYYLLDSIKTSSAFFCFFPPLSLHFFSHISKADNISKIISYGKNSGLVALRRGVPQVPSGSPET